MPITAWLLSLSTYWLTEMVGCLKEEAVRTITGSILNANVLFFVFFFSFFPFQGPLSKRLCNFLWSSNRNLFFKSHVWTHNSSLVTHVRKDSVNSPLNHLILASIFFLAVLFVTLSKNSWLRTLCILRYKLRVLAEPESSFGRYFSRPFIKKKTTGSFGNSGKNLPFHFHLL